MAGHVNMAAALRPPGPLERSPEVVTFGVEEEFLLLDAHTGLTAPYAGEVIRRCNQPGRVVGECMAHMVETRTQICSTLAALGDDLHDARARVSAAARDVGVACVPYPVPPFGTPSADQIVDDARYRELARLLPRAMRTSGTCACHVHVGVPSRRAGVEVLGHLRRWLPALIVLTAGSPVWQGHDTGWASQRLRLVSRWPTAVPPPLVDSPEAYDEQVRRAVSSGLALDARSVYYLARLSPRHPTVEVRVADVSATVDEAVTYTAVVVALVTGALRAWRDGAPRPAVPDDRLRHVGLEAAHRGTAGVYLDPVTGTVTSTAAMVDALATMVRPELQRLGDGAATLAALPRIVATGGPAAQERHRFAEAGSPRAFVSSLAQLMTGTRASRTITWSARPARLDH
ncbi:MAG: YbdK family carboxylate-amine ligase [Nocardioidaceae bacterium]